MRGRRCLTSHTESIHTAGGLLPLGCLMRMYAEIDVVEIGLTHCLAYKGTTGWPRWYNILS